jgi:hypothetical protein
VIYHLSGLDQGAFGLGNVQDHLDKAASSRPDLKNWPTNAPTSGVAPEAWKAPQAAATP